MRVALVHAGGNPDSLQDRLWDAVCQTWPTADRYSSQFLAASESSATTIAPAHQASLSWGREGTTAGRRLPQRGRGQPVPLSGYDVVISTSYEASCAIQTPSETVHACYVCGTHPGATGDSTAWRSGPTALRVHDPEHDAVSSYPAIQGHNSVTHLLAASHAAWSHAALNFRPAPARIMPVPVNTTFYRPDQAARQGQYLLVTQGQSDSAVELVLDACRTLQRPVTIVTPEPLQYSLRGAGVPVTCVTNPDQEKLRQLYRTSRALLAVEATDFDASLLDAQACGTPVIAYGLSGASEVVWDAESSGVGTGLLFHEMTVASLVSAMRELERRPQHFSPAISLTHISQYSLGNFEQALRNQMGRWQREHLDLLQRAELTISHRSQALVGRAA